MKILKIFGIVVGIHVFALILIFANPGCSSTTKPAPSPSDTAAKPDAAPMITPAASPPGIYTSNTDTGNPPPVTFNPDAPASAAPAGSTGSRVMPTRPGTPVAGVLVAEPVANVLPATPYTVKSGDNLSTIARRNNITTAQLAAANGLPTNSILRIGQKMIIPGKAASAAAPAPAAANGRTTSTAQIFGSADTTGDVMKHTVKAGETLGGIAKKYSVRQADIALHNNITDPGRIRPGMELVIPGWNAAGTKAGKSGPQPVPNTIEPIPGSQPQTQPTPPTVPVLKIDEPSGTPKQP